MSKQIPRVVAKQRPEAGGGSSSGGFLPLADYVVGELLR